MMIILPFGLFLGVFFWVLLSIYTESESIEWPQKDSNLPRIKKA